MKPAKPKASKKDAVKAAVATGKAKTEAKAEATTQTEGQPAAAPVDGATQPGTIQPVAGTAASPIKKLTDTQSVMQILNEQDALVAAETLVKQVDETYFTLGGVLSHIYAEGIHKSIGFEGKRGFSNYCEQRLGIAYRKSQTNLGSHAQMWGYLPTILWEWWAAEPDGAHGL